MYHLLIILFGGFIACGQWFLINCDTTGTVLASTYYQAHNINTPCPLPLFKKYPLLQKNLPHVQLGNFPTPIHSCTVLEQALPVKKLLIKRDDMSGKINNSGMRLLGGNKIRKLEFLLADALASQAQCIVTFGCAGSNHALATAMYGKDLGLNVILMLKPQWNSYIVRRNLLLDYSTGATLKFSLTNDQQELDCIHECAKYQREHGTMPYRIPTGGSCVQGIIGFVNAAFELNEQQKKGLLPEPDLLYVPVGSMGTYVGLLLGCKAAQLHCRVIGIAVEPEEMAGDFKSGIQVLFEQANQFLHDRDTSFPLFELTQEEIAIVYNYSGSDYALFTHEGMRALKLLRETENIQLDGVYTAKAFAGMLDDVHNKQAHNATVLFWHTFCSDYYKNIINSIDYKQLPFDFHVYFESDVQQLDYSSVNQE